MENTSGLGKTSVVPEEIKGWNWAHFFGIGFGVYVMGHS